ncbi:ABC transporter permease [Rhizobium leguminosarum]|uniref:ABC transporter permease n=1 Tax=Rhizobium leguminosarum TaxID=384 RepID=UPI00143F6714|nr:ABC transporter permease [Rhizobium leguminosarum]NKL21246.1 ABC transporter permease subunit [Rhizobium leguminosarum bv. viciae]NKL56753.1 ABC transporter permease subunit [Rhizobium leguminosarum bv. viciae]
MNNARRTILGAALPVIIIAGYAIWTSNTRNPFFPSPLVIAQRFEELWLFDRVVSDVLPSLRNLLVGYAIAVMLGILVGLALGRVKLLRLLFTPLVDFARSIPVIMLIPPFVLVLGIGDASKLAIIALGAFFPIVLATIDGLRRTDPALIDVTRSLRLPWWKEITVAWLPSAAPSISGGMQTGLQFAFILMVASEMLAAIRGLGYVTMQAQLTFDSTSVWAGIVLLAILGFLLNTAFISIRDRVLRWHVQSRASARSR